MSADLNVPFHQHPTTPVDSIISFYQPGRFFFLKSTVHEAHLGNPPSPDHPPLSWPVRTPVNHRPPTRDGTRAFPGAGASHPFKRRAFKANIKTTRRLKKAPFTWPPSGARPSSGSHIFCVAAVYSGSSGGVRLAGYKFWRRSVAVKQRPPCLCVRVCCGDGGTCACARGWEMEEVGGAPRWRMAAGDGALCYMTTRRNARASAVFFWVFFFISFCDFIVQWCVQVIATKLNDNRTHKQNNRKTILSK